MILNINLSEELKNSIIEYPEIISVYLNDICVGDAIIESDFTAIVDIIKNDYISIMENNLELYVIGNIIKNKDNIIGS